MFEFVHMHKTIIEIMLRNKCTRFGSIHNEIARSAPCIDYAHAQYGSLVGLLRAPITERKRTLSTQVIRLLLDNPDIFSSIVTAGSIIDKESLSSFARSSHLRARGASRYV
jgi:hypothetical protein